MKRKQEVLWQKRKKAQKPKMSIAMLQESRIGGQIALRGYSYQFLYFCYLILSAMNERAVFQLEGIEDIDYNIHAKDKNRITHIQLKYSAVRQDASFMSSVLKNFLEAYLIDNSRSFKLVYDFVLAVGNLSKLFQGNLDSDARKYWQGVIAKIKSVNILWNWEVYDFADFISRISFENIEKKSLEDSVECALIEKFDISKGAQNPAHSWIRRIDFTGSGKLSGYYEGKKATPAIANNLPVSRPRLICVVIIIHITS